MTDNVYDCPLDEDEIERQSNLVRTAISTIINDSAMSLKDAYESQRVLSKKIRELEVLLKPLLQMPDIPDLQQVFVRFQQFKQRLTTIQMKLNTLDPRFQALEAKFQSNHQ